MGLDWLNLDLFSRPYDRFLAIIEFLPGSSWSRSPKLDAAGASNARVFQDDAVEVLAAGFADDSLHEVLLYFPDPWPKKRHHKRRIVQPVFADEIARVLAPGGIWRLATDWENYGQHMRDVLDVHPAFENIGDANGYVSAPPRRDTRFENRGVNKGHVVHDMAYRRRG